MGKSSTICASCQEEKSDLVERFGDKLCPDCLDYLEGQDIANNLDMDKSEFMFLQDILNVITSEDVTKKYFKDHLEKINSIIEKLEIAINE